MDWLVNVYADIFRKIKRGNYHGTMSNAKPIYLISLIDYSPQIATNAFEFLDEHLIQIYDTQKRLLDETCKTPFINPFFHLGSESFYQLVWNGNTKPKTNSHTPSAKYLRENLLYAKLDDELWDLLQVDENRQYLKNVIINSYLK